MTTFILHLRHSLPFCETQALTFSVFTAASFQISVHWIDAGSLEMIYTRVSDHRLKWFGRSDHNRVFQDYLRLYFDDVM